MFESKLQNELELKRKQFHKNIMYPNVGEYGPFTIPQQTLDELKNAVGINDTTDKLLSLMVIINVTRIMFVTTDEDVCIFTTNGINNDLPLTLWIKRYIYTINIKMRYIYIYNKKKCPNCFFNLRT